MSAKDQRLYFNIQRTAHGLQKIADRRLLDASGITTAQAVVLTLAAESREAKQRDIARMLGVNESAMTALVGRLEAMGMITRHRSPDDPRAWRLRLTKKGVDAVKRAGEAFARINALLDRALEESGSQGFAEALRAIQTALDEG